MQWLDSFLICSQSRVAMKKDGEPTKGMEEEKEQK
jgi:hypothetical protein